MPEPHLPKSQDPEDLVAFAVEMLQLYAPHLLARPHGVLMVPRPLSDEQVAEIKRRWEEDYRRGVIQWVPDTKVSEIEFDPSGLD